MADANKQLAEAVKGSNVPKVNPTVDNSVYGQLERSEAQFKKALACTNEQAERFVRVITSAVRNNNDLMKCVPRSIVGAAMSMAQLGFDPTLSQGWLIPRWNKNKKIMECSFQVGLRGWQDLFYRAVPGAILESRIIWNYDGFKFAYGINRVLEHIPYENEANVVESELMFVYAIARFPGESKQYKFDVMSKREVEDFRDKYSKQYIYAVKENKLWSSVWHKNFPEMALGAVMKKLLKDLPKSVEIQHAMSDEFRIKYMPPENEITAEFNILNTAPEPENSQDPVTIPKETSQPKAATPGVTKTSPVTKPPEPSKEVEAQATVSDDGEVTESADDIRSSLKAMYLNLRKQDPVGYTDENIKAINKEELGVVNLNTCKNIKKLITLREKLSELLTPPDALETAIKNSQKEGEETGEDDI